MSLQYVCSAYKGDVEKNVENAKRYCRFVSYSDNVPIAPHLLFPQFLGSGDMDEHARLKGVSMGMELMEHCNKMWVFGDEVTEGMCLEIKKARELGLQIAFRNSDMEEINYDTLIINKRIGDGLKQIIKDVNEDRRRIKDGTSDGRRTGKNHSKFSKGFFTRNKY